MRLRVGLLLCLFAVIAMVGCRKPLAPNVDRNKAPETWITAAPFDSVTLVKGDPPLPRSIPVRFHAYWAGSDQDGSVVGYYLAVVETIPFPPLPQLPGPRSTDYHYTTRTDSILVFNVAEDIPDRQHAFYIYAVDDKGKGDPTPARFIFSALDRYPPVPKFDAAFATGTVHYFDQFGVLRSETRSFPIRDTLRFGGAPPDTVPSGSRVTFRFHGEVAVAGSVIKGFRYKFDEPQLQPVNPDSLFHGGVIEYGVPPDSADPSRGGIDIQAVTPGTKTFQLRAVDQANGSLDAFRRFQMNFSPDTWFSGPDPGVAGGPWQTNSRGEKFAVFSGLRLPSTGLPGTLLGPDSVLILPANRPPRRTFLEFYKDTVFIRAEFDTVHMGSWVVFHNGGFDRDSPYAVKVVDGIEIIQPSFPGGPVLTKAGQNGSPIGFRSLVTNYQTPNGPLASSAQSRLYPYYDPNDVLNFQRIGAYHPMTRSGRAYSLQRAEDGDGARDGRVNDARHAVEFPSDKEKGYRPLVMVFEVNFPPVLETDDPSFRPRVSVIDTLRAPEWNLELPVSNVDPFSGIAAGGPVGGSTFRLRFKITGQDTIPGRTFTYTDPGTYINPGSQINLPVPPRLSTGPATLTIELCDCSFCELNPGEGRCITRDIQVYHVALPPARTATPSRPGLD
jgi:hypothetical protein